jgi:molybdopterin biosynthesis enzyme
MGVDMRNIGIIGDDVRAFEVLMSICLRESSFDVIITTGAVYVGNSIS